MPEAVSPSGHPLDAMLAVSDVLTNERYARIYARVLELETPTVAEIAEGLDSSTTTVYEDVSHLTEIAILERVTETQPHRYRARAVEMTVQTGEGTYRISPTLLVALARRDRNENLRLYVDRHGIAGLATAIDSARKYVRGRTSARLLAREQGVPVLEAETILQELREIILEVEPEVDESLDVEELDDAVGELSEE